MIIMCHALKCLGLDICGFDIPRCGEVILIVFPIMLFLFVVRKFHGWGVFLHMKHVLLHMMCGRPSHEKAYSHARGYFFA